LNPGSLEGFPVSVGGSKENPHVGEWPTGSPLVRPTNRTVGARPALREDAAQKLVINLPGISPHYVEDRTTSTFRLRAAWRALWRVLGKGGPAS
jgi:hypothetical protein